MTQDMIVTESLSVRYGRAVALRDVSLRIPRRHITAIIGPSGCGKSSFLHALNRMTDLIDGASVTGSVWIDGQDIHDKRVAPAELRKAVGMIFQKPTPFDMSVRRNIELALKEHGERSRLRRAEITERVLRDVGLWDEVSDRLDAPALALSGGQQQRLCIARAIALQPRVLLMDEPCSALDPTASANVEALIRELRGDYTIVIVTHNLAQARRIADDVAVFWQRDGEGRLIEKGPAEQLFAQPQSETAAAYIAGTQG